MKRLLRDAALEICANRLKTSLEATSLAGRITILEPIPHNLNSAAAPFTSISIDVC
jgi:hypothetical protein